MAGRLVYVQVVQGPEYAEAAAQQRMRDITINPERGFIYDREGEVLAESMEARTIYAVPGAVEDKAGAAAAIANAIGGSAVDYEEKLSRDSNFVYIARKVDVGQAESLRSLEIAGLGFLEDSRRVYPSNELACQVLGFVGVDDEGLSGLELYYEDLLGGSPGRLIGERDTSGRPIPGGVTYEEEAVDGEDIVLTIDKDIQYQAQVALAEAVQKWGAKAGSVIVMDPRNGEILAMASYPQFNPNRFGEADEDAFRNRAIVDTYEPGSTIKSLTAAAVIDAGLHDPASVFELPPTIDIGGRTIHESHDRAAVSWTLTDIVTQSSNVGAVKLGLSLGEEALYDYFSRFGLTEKTGVDYPGEVKGWLGAPDQWSPSSLATITFGQGVSVTPLQLTRALAAIANGGDLITPHFLKEAAVETEKAPTLVTKRAISEETARQMRIVLTDVVHEGTGAAAAVPGYEVAGKTGTAQKARTDGRAGYAEGKYVASFSGFLPADDPRIVIVVNIDEPSNSIYGGTVAAPTFSRIAAYCVDHLKIPPGEPVTSESQGGAE
ncbi:MAG: penicillin-binding protein 2 [Coriobacteriia bacterium]|nr:penicillin-binding protein 2 [Coriobacteriia bacterium]MBN2841129.1 penicillin-binding protein 2 [Coriobacteriia bacterium]